MVDGCVLANYRIRRGLFDAGSKQQSMIEPLPSPGRLITLERPRRAVATDQERRRADAIRATARIAPAAHDSRSAGSPVCDATARSVAIDNARWSSMRPRARPPTRTERQFSRRSMRCFGSGFSSPFSTRFTISVSAAFAGVGMPISSPLRTIRPLRNSISVRRPFTMS